MKKFILTAFLISLTLTTIFAQSGTDNHIVKKGETLYRLSVMYKLSIPDIKTVNPQIVGDNINVGDIVKIPNGEAELMDMSSGFGKDNGIEVKLGGVPGIDMGADKLNAKTAKKYKKSLTEIKNPLSGPLPASGGIILDVPSLPSTNKPVEAYIKPIPHVIVNPEDVIGKDEIVDLGEIKPVRHIVSSGETLYGLSKMYSQNVKALQNWNDLQGGIKEGQGIIVGWLVPEGAKALSVPKKIAKPMTPFQRKYFGMVNDTLDNYRQKVQEGIATWFEETDPSAGDNMYALHKSAPLFSIVRVTNPINNRSVYLKVIQQLPDNTANEGVLIRMTSSAAKELNMLDKKSLVSTRYFLKK